MKTRQGYEVVDFKNKPIRILREGGAKNIWICLYDLCKILKRPMMMETKEAQNLCPSCTRVIFKKNDKALWGIHPRDVSKLVYFLKKESRLMETLCTELEQWAEDFSNNGKDLFVVDQKTPIVFKYKDKFPITFKVGNGKMFVNATEMSKSVGKSPAVWLRFSSTSELRHSLVKAGKSESFERQVITSRGSNGATWIEESLVFEFAEWLSDDMVKWCNEKVQELVLDGLMLNHPQSSFSMERFPVPTTMEEALRLAAEQQDEIVKLKEEVEENKPKIEFYNSFIENRDFFKSTTIADELQITTRALHTFLRDENICKYEDGQWIVNGSHAALQCEIPYYWETKKGKSYVFTRLKRWTPAGREYILELWRSKHPDNKKRK